MPQSPEVTAWLKAYDNPMKPVVMRVRKHVLAADKRIAECIKWQSPTFTFEGNLASFNPRSKKHASLMFHTGAKIPGKHPALQGGGGTARYMSFADVAEADAKADAIAAVVKAWCDWRAAGSTKKAPVKKKAPAKKKAPVKKKAPAKKKARRG